MATNNNLRHIASATEPKGANVGDEWYNLSNNTLYKRLVSSTGALVWLDITTTNSSGNKVLVNPAITGYVETVSYQTVIGNALTISLDNGSFQSISTMAGANAITLPRSTSAGKNVTLLINYVNTPTSLTFATTLGTIKWNGATTPTPTLTNGKIDFYTFVSDGVNWYGLQSANY
jgi:hypothetical protein